MQTLNENATKAVDPARFTAASTTQPSSIRPASPTAAWHAIEKKHQIRRPESIAARARRFAALRT